MAADDGPLAVLYFARDAISQTLSQLREGGVRGCETALMWLGRRSEYDQSVEEVYRPQQKVAEDFFHIPPSGMRSMMAHLRSRRLNLLAQVHSHPELAFHSKADDRWAVVRHVGALSLVVPWFAARTSVDSFLDDIAVFQLSPDDAWCPVAARSVLEMKP